MAEEERYKHKEPKVDSVHENPDTESIKQRYRSLGVSELYDTEGEIVDLENDVILMCDDWMDAQAAIQVFTMYKPSHLRARPVPGVYPEETKVRRNIPEDPLRTLPKIDKHPPEFRPTKRITPERLKVLNINADSFLSKEEEKLFTQVMMNNEDVFAFDESERGTFREDYFFPYIIPTVPHEVWKHANIPIPPGIREQVIEMLRDKIKAGVYEPSQSSYRSRWFCVMKKNGKLRIVHDLQPLNRVTIKDSSMPPVLDNFVEPFAHRACNSVFDLFWGFDARKIAESSWDLTAFMTPLGLLRLTSIPMGFTNSVGEFQNCMAFILSEEIETHCNIFIDDLAIRGPATEYLDENGKAEVLSENAGIRKFIWEHAVDVNRILHRIKCAGATFSPGKIQLCSPEVIILGQKCTPQGRVPDPKKVDKIRNWPPLKNVKDVRGFLGLCGTVRIWIRNYSEIIRPLTELIRFDTVFEWTSRRSEAFEMLKEIVASAPALRPIDYTSLKPIILSVDSSKIAVGFILSQLDEEWKRRPARYGSIPMSDRESRYSQPKLELFGLYRALRHFRIYIIGVRNFYVEVDAQYIRGMLNEPDLQPNAAVNRWIQGILLYDFILVHVPATRFKGPDGLSRRSLGEGEEVESDNDDWLDDVTLLGSSHFGKIDLRQRSHATEFPYAINDLPTCHKAAAVLQDALLREIWEFLETLKYPERIRTGTMQEQRRFVAKATQFFVKRKQLYKRNAHGSPLLVILDIEKRIELLMEAHEGSGHRGEQSVFEMLRKRVFWPHMHADIRHHVRSCHQCQVRDTKKMVVPPIISMPATIFTKIYLDTMRMPEVDGVNAIIAARDDLSRVTEVRAVWSGDSEQAADFLWEQIYCRYGAVGEVVTDNGSEFKAAFDKLLERKLKIPQIRISHYNKRANGVVEQGHFVLREALVKECDGDLTRWPYLLPHAAFTDRITVSRVTGVSPFYALHGVEPVLPLDLTEATFMVEGFKQGMSSVDLFVLRMRQLEKHPEELARASQKLIEHRLQSKEYFERRFHKRLRTGKEDAEYLRPGQWILIRNSAIEEQLNRKTMQRYIGPFIIVRQTRNGAWVIKDPDGTVHRRAVAAFRIVPYIARSKKILQDLAAPDPELVNEILDEIMEEVEEMESDDDLFLNRA